EQIDVVGAETTQALLAGANQIAPRGPDIVGAWADPVVSLRCDDRLVAPGADGFAQNLLGSTIGVRVGRIKEVHPRVQTAPDDALGAAQIRIRDPAVATPAAEGHRPETQRRYLQAACPERPRFDRHGTHTSLTT